MPPRECDGSPKPGWYALSVNYIYGRDRQYRYFLNFEPAAMAGYSIYIYHITLEEANRVRRELGLAELTAGTNVTVNSVLPGPTRSEGVEVFVQQMAAAQKTDETAIETMFFEKIRPSSLLKRFERPEEIADLVAYLASPLASGTNGAAVRVDGGVLRSAV